MDSTHRTGAVSCSPSRRRAVGPSCTGAAVTLATTGATGRPNVVRSSSRSSPPAAGAMSGEWNAPLTRMGSTRRAPSTLSAAPARSMAAASPEMTVCSGALRLAATATAPLPLARASTSITVSPGSPTTTAMVPGRSAPA
jgi:hypothetical protein